MKNIRECSREELVALEQELQTKYDELKAKGLKLDMSRGKPAPAQLDLADGLLTALTQDCKTQAGLDARNYGVLDGIPEMKQIFAELTGIPAEQIIVGGNSSLNLMFDAMMRLYVFGTDGCTPWKDQGRIRWLCPAPGYDRHFAVTETLGFEMLPVPMTENGPDMDMVEKLVAEDPQIKGIWCVPLYSNPQGICYSDETVDRLAAMKTAAPDFRIFWDNAYGVHHIYGETALKDIFAACREAGNENRPLYFFSTSKITYPGAGVSMVAASPANIAEIKKVMTVQTIGHDKINQLRHVKYFGCAENVKAHMRKLGDSLRPKFDMVLQMLEQELAGSGLATWCSPKGGYFVAVDTMPGCARATVALAKEAGVVMTGAGATYPYKNDPQDTNIRIAPSYPTPEELAQAMELFCLCVKLAGVRKLLAA